jgi:LytS/YehU family sensor histidine kinase
MYIRVAYSGNFYLLNDQELIDKVVMFSLLPFLAAFSFIFFVFYRQNRESQVRKDRLELELRALRAQINPHFIFNCLNSIHYCIREQKNQQAGDYLLKFSFLVRRILENSGKQWITLREELEILKTYIDLEQLRSDYTFHYRIEVDEQLDPENTAVPMLLAQQFVENSIWHAFSPSHEDNHLSISFRLVGNQLIIEVNDNGKINAEKQYTSFPGKQKSLGTDLMNDQLKAIRELQNQPASFEKITLCDEHGNHAGTKVFIQLPFNQLF